jgi:prolyl-tRNA synthetase
MYAAYERIFNRCVIVFRAVEADAGAIGGEGGTHEFIALSEVGEDTILICPSCDYAANVEVAADISEGDSCPRCHAGVISSLKGIEIGHVFKLGTKYSEALGAKFLDASGKENPIIMGCYGIGVSRLLATYIEQNHDDLGIIWKPEIAPFHVHLVQVSLKDEAQQTVSNEIYETLTSHGIETLWDDRDERPGVKFNESDLMGIPVRIVIGKHASDGNVELIKRATNERRIVSKDKVLEAISDLLK